MHFLAESPPNFDPSAKWHDGGTRTIVTTPIFRLLEAQRESPHGFAKGTFYRLACPQWVHIIPFTTQSAGLELLAVEQYRHGIDGASLEVPGGVGNPGESPLEAAKRELLEETGHVSENWTDLGFCTPNPAIQDNRCHFFLALNCVPAHDLALDPTEELRVLTMPFQEWEGKLKSGEIHHGLILAAFERLRLSPAWGPLESMIAGG